MSFQLPEQTKKWMEKSFHSKAHVKSVEPLKGGLSSLVQLIQLEVAGEMREVVLRQILNKEWLEEEPDLVIHEASSLKVAEKTKVSTPQILTYDQIGEECGVPAVLMSKLAGEVCLHPTNWQKWIEGLARALAEIHIVEVQDFPWTYYTYRDLDALTVPSWSAYPQQWEEINKIAKGPRPAFSPCFIHRDYHPTNVLWSGDSVSGVVDWINACIGPAGIDVGHCRVNLAQLYGVEVADAFLESYLYFAGEHFQYDPYWDIISLLDITFGEPEVYQGWIDLGVTGLSKQLIIRRLDTYMISLLEKYKLWRNL